MSRCKYLNIVSIISIVRITIIASIVIIVNIVSTTSIISSASVVSMYVCNVVFNIVILVFFFCKTFLFHPKKN